MRLIIVLMLTSSICLNTASRADWSNIHVEFSTVGNKTFALIERKENPLSQRKTKPKHRGHGTNTLWEKTTISDKVIRHLDKFRHFCPVKQPEDASLISLNIIFVGQKFPSLLSDKVPRNVTASKKSTTQKYKNSHGGKNGDF